MLKNENKKMKEQLILYQSSVPNKDNIRLNNNLTPKKKPQIINPSSGNINNINIRKNQKYYQCNSDKNIKDTNSNNIISLNKNRRNKSNRKKFKNNNHNKKYSRFYLTEKIQKLS